MRILISLTTLLLTSSSMRLQGVAVKGKLKCGEKIHRNVKIKIYDVDRNPGDDDERLDEKYTNKYSFAPTKHRYSPENFEYFGGNSNAVLATTHLFLKHFFQDGEFMVTGTTRELTDIEPVLYIYHDCDDGIRPCQKRITMVIPKHYIHHGTPEKWFDVGELNLEMEFPGQDRSCNH